MSDKRIYLVEDRRNRLGPEFFVPHVFVDAEKFSYHWICDVLKDPPAKTRLV